MPKTDMKPWNHLSDGQSCLSPGHGINKTEKEMIRMRKGLIMTVIALLVTITFGISFAGSLMKGVEIFKDKTLGTNGNSCNTCHPRGSGINGKKASFTIMGKKQSTIEDAVNFCIKNALQGKPLKKDSEKMKDLVSYLKTLTGKKH